MGNICMQYLVRKLRRRNEQQFQSVNVIIYASIMNISMTCWCHAVVCVWCCSFNIVHSNPITFHTVRNYAVIYC